MQNANFFSAKIFSTVQCDQGNYIKEVTSEQRGLIVSNTQNRYFVEYFTKM